MFDLKIAPLANKNTIGTFKVDEETIDVDENGILYDKEYQQSLQEDYSQSTAPDNHIEEVITKYYNKEYNLEDIQSIQSVGDIRQVISKDTIKMQIEAHNSFTSDYSNSIVNQLTVKQVIIDFDHDILTTSINGITKALITIQMYGTLGTSPSSGAYGYLHTSGEAVNQQNIAKRNYCNDNFYNALGFKSQVKQVHKPCCSYNSSTIFYTDDYCFLPSYTEIFTYNSSYTKAAEGVQYNYYATSANRIKKAGQEGTGSDSIQQLRSPYQNSSISYCIVNSSGTGSYASIRSTYYSSICTAI